MTFKIIVCIKQVPDTNDIKWTKKNTIQREGLDLIINPYDLGAIQLALDVKKYILDTQIILVSMGPNQALESLNYGLALGADTAFLLCDRKFAASDTLATAYCLCGFIKQHCGDFNLIICGQQAVDGDTAQVPSALAEKLDIPSITLAKELKFIDTKMVNIIRETPAKTEEVEVALPSLLAVDIQETKKQPSIEDFMKAQDKKITILSAADIDCLETNIGFSGSPTQVKKAFRPEKHRDVVILENLSNEEFIEVLMGEINKAENQ